MPLPVHAAVQVEAIRLERIHGHFRRRNRPRISASIPELKNVRTASAGEPTIGSPRRLKEVFITTGTPVRWRNSSIRRQ